MLQLISSILSSLLLLSISMGSVINISPKAKFLSKDFVVLDAVFTNMDKIVTLGETFEPVANEWRYHLDEWDVGKQTWLRSTALEFDPREAGSVGKCNKLSFCGYPTVSSLAPTVIN
jgi:hypothetical protein